MAPLLIIFALASVVGLGCLLLALIVGAWLLRTRPSSPIGVFVLIVPTLSTVSALATSWALASFLDSLSKSAASADAWQRWQVLALWAWPIGFIVGGETGAAAGTLTAVLVVRHKRSSRGRANALGGLK
jgi:hypothetical protein